MLTESEVQASYRKLMKNWSVDPTTFEKAEQLLEQLRPESPLRHRLETELNEVRRLQKQ